MNSTPRQLAREEEVYESEPACDADEREWLEVTERLDPEGTLAGYSVVFPFIHQFYDMYCRTGVSAMWKELNRHDPALLENFEGFLVEVVSELKQSDMEKSTLQTHVKR